MDPNQQSRNGGGEQVITDGRYRTEAVVNTSILFQQKNLYKTKELVNLE